MNFSQILNLLDESYKVVAVSFSATPNHPQSNIYWYKTPKNLKLEAGDLVVVPVPTGFKIATVVEDDVCADLYERDIEWKWVAQVVDLSSYKILTERDQAILANLKKAEKERKRKEFLESATWAEKCIINEKLTGIENNGD